MGGAEGSGPSDKQEEQSLDLSTKENVKGVVEAGL